MADLDLDPLAEDKGMFDDILEFPHISWVIVIEESPHHSLGDRPDLLPRLLVQLSDEMLDQEREVFLPLPERWDLELHNVQTIE